MISEDEHLRKAILESSASFKDAVQRDDKSFLQAVHRRIRDAVDDPSYSAATRKYEKFSRYFIHGRELEPQRIKLTLVVVRPGSLEEELFRLVRRTWSIPFSKGYGRRVRLLVFDEHHEAVIGIIGLQSPPADLQCRDRLFNCPVDRKLDLVNRTLDVFSLGAVPPYSILLGGKLVAGLVHSPKVREAYRSQYVDCVSVLGRKVISDILVAATTTSAFGRSSIYNRLAYGGRRLAEPIGFTKGYGLIHLEEIYPSMLRFLASKGVPIRGGFGAGPKHRWQIVTKTLRLLNLPDNLLQHGLRREVFLFRFSLGLEEGMAGGAFGTAIHFSEEDYVSFWMRRWMAPRAASTDIWRAFDPDEYFAASFQRNRDKLIRISH